MDSVLRRRRWGCIFSFSLLMGRGFATRGQWVLEGEGNEDIGMQIVKRERMCEIQRVREL